MSDELEELKRKKLEALQQNQQDQVQEEAQLGQQVEQLEAIIRQHLTKDALERYGNIKAAQPEKAVQVLAILGQLIQTGKVDIINDEMFRQILLKITPQKKEIKITRK
jgi:programmed cell death protein 5